MRQTRNDWGDPQEPLSSRHLDLLRDTRPTLVVAHSFGCLATLQ